MILMIALEEEHVVFTVIGKNLIIINMKKRLSACIDCGDDTSILTQVSSGPDIMMLCSDCYNLKYLRDEQNEIIYNEKEKN